jgi:hypothetical protein
LFVSLVLDAASGEALAIKLAASSDDAEASTARRCASRGMALSAQTLH